MPRFTIRYSPMFRFEYALAYYAPFPHTHEYWPVGVVVLGTDSPAFEVALAVRMGDRLARLLPALSGTDYTGQVMAFRQALLGCQKQVRRGDLALAEVWAHVSKVDTEAFRWSPPTRVLARDPEELCFELYQRYVLPADRLLSFV